MQSNKDRYNLQLYTSFRRLLFNHTATTGSQATSGMSFRIEYSVLRVLRIKRCWESPMSESMSLCVHISVGPGAQDLEKRLHISACTVRLYKFLISLHQLSTLLLPSHWSPRRGGKKTSPCKVTSCTVYEIPACRLQPLTTLTSNSGSRSYMKGDDWSPCP